MAQTFDIKSEAPAFNLSEGVQGQRRLSVASNAGPSCDADDGSGACPVCGDILHGKTRYCAKHQRAYHNLQRAATKGSTKDKMTEEHEAFRP
jgi:hypothetical protein